MIYLAILNTDVYGKGGMVHSKRASLYFKRRFDSLIQAGEYLLTNHAGPRAMFGDPNKSFKQISQLCLANGRIVYYWDLRNINSEELGHIARYIDPVDWQFLFDSNPDFYDLSIKKLGYVHGIALSDKFVTEHYEHLNFFDIKDDEYEGRKTLYDWVRIRTPQAFMAIETQLLEGGIELPDVRTIINEVKEKVRSAGGTQRKTFEKLGDPAELATKSKYYAKVEYGKLVDLYKQAFWQVDQGQKMAARAR